MNKAQALHAFWSGFNIPAYDENSVPDEAVFPYITYGAKIDDFDNSIFSSATLWYRSTSWVSVTEKEQEISEFIGRGGRLIAYTEGAMWIQKGSPWAQRIGDPSDNMIRGIILNFTIEFLN